MSERIKKENQQQDSTGLLLDEVRAKIRNIIKAIENGAASEVLVSRLSDLEDQERDLQAQHEKVRLDEKAFSEESIFEWFKKIATGDPLDKEYQKKLLLFS